MASQVDIYNLALAAIGTRTSVASISEASPEARELSRQYDAALDAVLAAAHWNFARKQTTLTLLKAAYGTEENPDDETSVPPQPWRYEYAYPGDAIGARYLMPTIDSASSVVGQPAGPQYVSGPVRFIVGLDEDSQQNDQKVILTHQADAVLVYTKRITNTLLFDGQFVQAFAAFMGSKVCMALTGDKGMMRAAFELAASLTHEARATNGNEGGPTVIDNVPDWIRARGGDEVGMDPQGLYILPPINLSFPA
jgi:hypothetical protein